MWGCLMENNTINLSREELETLIAEECYAHVVKYHDEKYEEMDSIYRQVKVLSTDIFESNIRVLNRLQEIESMISAHSVGVQNVYDELKVIKEVYEVSKIDKDLFNKIHRIKQIMEE